MDLNFENTLKLLNHPSTDILTKNRLALELSETQNSQFFPTLVQLIENHENFNQRGTFVYCLKYFPVEKWFDIVINLLLTGNWEVAHEAGGLLENIEEIHGDFVKNAFKKLNNAEKNQMENWRITLIDDVLAMFE